jgi:hypothetical protein
VGFFETRCYIEKTVKKIRIYEVFARLNHTIYVVLSQQSHKTMILLFYLSTGRVVYTVEKQTFGKIRCKVIYEKNVPTSHD